MFQFLISLVLFALAVLAIVNIINSSVETTMKVLWILGVLLFPLIGFVAWYFAGPRPAR